MPDLDALRDLDGFAGEIVRAYWMVRLATPADQPVPPSEIRVVLEELGLADRFLEMAPLLMELDGEWAAHRVRCAKRQDADAGAAAKKKRGG